MLHQVLNLLAKLVGQAEARRVRDVHHRGPGPDDSLHHAGQVLVVRTTGIFGIELHVLHVALGVLHGTHGALDDFLRRGVELIPDVALAGADARVYAFVFGILQCLGGHVDVLLHGPGQGTDGGPRHGLGDFHYGVEVAGTRNGESRLYDVHAQLLQRLGHLYLLHGVQLATGHLLAVAQRGVENKQSVTHSSFYLIIFNQM